MKHGKYVQRNSEIHPSVCYSNDVSGYKNMSIFQGGFPKEFLKREEVSI